MESTASSPLLDEIEERLLFARLDREIEVIAASLAKAEPLPRPSLMGRLLVPFRAGEREGVRTLRSWLAPEGNATLRRPARDQLHKCKVRKNGQSTTLEELLTGILDERPGAVDPGRRLVEMSGILAEVIGNAHLRGEQKAMECFHKQMDVVRGRLIVAILTRLAKRAAIGDLGGRRGGQRATANSR